MKKQFLTIVTLAFGALVLITNCKKKEDSPAPATTTTTGTTTSGTTSGTTTTGTTTSGTTTSGTTTAGTTTSGTTTSGTTTSGTTTSGTTTAGTTSGSTTGSTTGGLVFTGSGTFSVNGTSITGSTYYKMQTATPAMWTFVAQDANYSLQIRYSGTEFPASGTYSLGGSIPLTAGLFGITVVDLKNSKQYLSQTTDTGKVTVSGSTMSVSGLTIKSYTSAETITLSANVTY